MFDKAIRTPAQLTGVARGVLDGVYGASGVAPYMPIRENQSIMFDFNIDESTLPQAASFRAFNTESDQTTSAGTQSRSGKLPPISRRHNIDEYTAIKLMGGDLGAKFEEKVTQISAEIAYRFIVGAAEAIETGKLTIDERGLKFELDYGRDSALTATAATVWSNPAADIIGDLKALRAAYGSTPGAIQIPTAVLEHMSKNEQIIQLALRSGGNLPNQVSYADVQSVLASFNLWGVTSNEERVAVNGVTRSLFSQDKVLFLPETGNLTVAALTGGGSLGSLDLGITAESLNSDTGVGGTPGLFAGALASHDPEGYNVLVSGIGLPILSAANQTASLDVL